jgi:hypothetical protein
MLEFSGFESKSTINCLFLFMLRILALLLILNPCFVFGQPNLPMGGRANSMSNAMVAVLDPWAFHHNPGALAFQKTIAIGVSYENRFLLKELQSQGVVYVQPLKKGVLSLGAQLYGFELYRTTRAGVGYSLLLAENFSVGVQLNYLGLQLREQYGSAHAATAELGLLYTISEKWRMGCSVFNLGRTKFSDYQNERFGTTMRLGTSYNLSSKVLLSLEAEKNINYPLRAKMGMEYQPINQFFIRGGLSTAPFEGSFGFGYKFKPLQLDLGSSFHQVLGWSPHFSITFNMSK